LIRNKRLSVKIGDKVEFCRGNYVTVGTVETILYVSGTKARIVTEDGGRITLPVRDLKVLKETA